MFYLWRAEPKIVSITKQKIAAEQISHSWKKWALFPFLFLKLYFSI